MIEFYPEIRFVHVAAVVASGALFALRGGLSFAGTGWGTAPALRYLSYAIDCTLLTAAFMLMTILGQYPLAQAWLTAKIVLLMVYIALGYMALWKARTQKARVAYWIAALAVFALIVTVARTRNPLGFLGLLAG
jgi:uncharacterized membrane protein SirB2